MSVDTIKPYMYVHKLNNDCFQKLAVTRTLTERILLE